MATKANLIIDQGTTFVTTINMTDLDGVIIDLTGYTGEAQIRKHYTSTTAVSFGVNINVSLGTVDLTLSADASSLMSPGRYVYDLILTDTSGNISRVIEGIVTLTPRVTQ